MFTLAEDELEQAYQAISHHGYSALLPDAYEWTTVVNNWMKIREYLTKIDLDNYMPHKPLQIFAPKSRANIRIVHLLHPEDLLIYTALVMIVKNDIESARIPKRNQRVYSYRVSKEQSSHLYNARGAHDKYLAQLRNKATKKSTKFVAIGDIADFYPRIYQHRLQNVIEATATAQRGADVARVLVKKLINKLMGGNSYGIPVGPYASRILGEAILIDVDAHLLSKGVDFVRWVDDYNIFARSEYLAQSMIFELAEWLFSNHGLTLQSSKTKILPASRYLDEIANSPEENLTDRDQVVFLLREAAGDLDYGEVESVVGGDDLEERRIEEILEKIQSYDLRGMLVESMSDQALVDYEMVQYVLSRLPRIPGADNELKSDILHLVLDNADLLYPASEHIAQYVTSFQDIPKGEKVRIARKLLKPLRSRNNRPPDYYAMWVLYVFSTSADWNCSNEIMGLYQSSTSELVKRFAALALAKGGSRANALAVKENISSASSLLRLAIFCSTNRLGKDERKFWKLANRSIGILEKFV